MTFLKSLIVAMLILIPGSNVFAAESGWMTYNKLGSLNKRISRKGYYAASVKCRNSPTAKVTARPELNVAWKKVGRFTKSAVMFHGGTNLVYPFFPGSAEGKKWKRKNGNRFRAGSTKSIYSCYLWLRTGG